MAEPPDLHRISAAIRDCLTGEVGGFAFGEVGRGRHGVVPPRIPWLEVSAPGIRSEQGPTMGQYTRTLVYEVQAWAQVDTGGLTERTETSERLADALLDALERERLTPASPLYSLNTFEASSVSLDAAADPVPTQAAYAMVVLEVTYRRRTGLAGTEAP